jgi:hypothetical protein
MYFATGLSKIRSQRLPPPPSAFAKAGVGVSHEPITFTSSCIKQQKESNDPSLLCLLAKRCETADRTGSYIFVRYLERWFRSVFDETKGDAPVTPAQLSHKKEKWCGSVHLLEVDLRSHYVLKSRTYVCGQNSNGQ